MNLEPKICYVCNKQFAPKTMKGKYCSIECSGKGFRQNRLIQDPDYFKRLNLMSRFGMTIEDWNTMFVAQGSACAICREAHASEQWSVDHCHKTGEVRGILCRKCNTGLGAFDDDTERMIEAILYLSRSQNIIVPQINEEVTK